MPAINPVFTGTSKDRRPNAVTFDYLTAFSPGPKANGDSTAGAVNRAWKLRVDNSTGTVYIAAATDDNTAWQTETVLFTFTGVPCIEVDFSFEQAARPVVVMERATGTAGASEVWLYWYDPRIPGFTFASLGAGRTPRTILDYPPDVTSSDVQVFYMKTASGIMRKQQRDLYLVEYATGVTDDLNSYLDDVAYTRSFQLACIWSLDNRDTGRYSLHRMESVPFPIPVNGDEFSSSMDLVDGEYFSTLIEYLMDTESYVTEMDLVGGSLIAPIILLTLYDIDKYSTSLALVGGSLAAPIILHTLYDIDKYATTLLLVGGSLSSVIIMHTLYDIDKFANTLSLVSGSLT